MRLLHHKVLRSMSQHWGRTGAATSWPPLHTQVEICSLLPLALTLTRRVSTVNREGRPRGTPNRSEARQECTLGYSYLQQQPNNQSSRPKARTSKSKRKQLSHHLCRLSNTLLLPPPSNPSVALTSPPSNPPQTPTNLPIHTTFRPPRWVKQQPPTKTTAQLNTTHFISTKSLSLIHI